MHLGKLKQVARRYWRFPVYHTPAELLGSLCRQMPPILLATYFSVEAVGLYWLTNRVLERPTMLFGADMSQVFPRTESANNNIEDTPQRRLLARLLARSAALTIAISRPIADQFRRL